MAFYFGNRGTPTYHALASACKLGFRVHPQTGAFLRGRGQGAAGRGRGQGAGGAGQGRAGPALGFRVVRD